MPVGRIARQNGSDGIDLQIKFSFTVPPVPLRGNGVNSPARLHRLGSLKRAGSRLIPANLPKSCSINITATQRFSLVTELRTVGVGWLDRLENFALQTTPRSSKIARLSANDYGACRVPPWKLKAENTLGQHELDGCSSRDVVNPWNFEQSLETN